MVICISVILRFIRKGLQWPLSYIRPSQMHQKCGLIRGVASLGENIMKMTHLQHEEVAFTDGVASLEGDPIRAGQPGPMY